MTRPRVRVFFSMFFPFFSLHLASLSQASRQLVHIFRAYETLETMDAIMIENGFLCVPDWVLTRVLHWTTELFILQNICQNDSERGSATIIFYLFTVHAVGMWSTYQGRTSYQQQQQKKLLAKLQNVATLKAYTSCQKFNRVVGWVHSIVEQ